MRFLADQGHAILRGGKTTHWIPATTPDPQLCPYQPGGLEPLTFPEVALDSYGQPILDTATGDRKYVYSHDARLRITTVTVSSLDELDDQAARAAGFPTGFAAFADWWQQTHCPNGITDHQATRPCWVIGFRVEYTDGTRYLQRVHGYTGSLARAIDDLTAVDDRDLQVAGELADRKRLKQDEVNARRRAATDLQQRVIDARNAAELKGLDVRDELRVLGAYVRRQDRAGVVRAVGNLERAVWPKAA